jgi:hypothetical protein
MRQRLRAIIRKEFTQLLRDRRTLVLTIALPVLLYPGILLLMGAIVAAGKPAGILTLDPDFAQTCIAWGTTFTAVGMDVALLAQGARALSARFRTE